MLLLFALRKRLRTAVWDRIYFGSDTRADALLVGALTAILLFWLVPRLGPRASIWFATASALALVVSSLIVLHAKVFVSGWLPEWGFLAFEVSIAVLVAGLVVLPRSPLARACAFVPLVWLGRRSYAIYLFHQLVFVYLVVAELSHRLIEAPMLRRRCRFEPSL